MPNPNTDEIREQLRTKQWELENLDTDDHAGQNVVLREIIEIQEILI